MRCEPFPFLSTAIGRSRWAFTEDQTAFQASGEGSAGRVASQSFSNLCVRSSHSAKHLHPARCSASAGSSGWLPGSVSLRITSSHNIVYRPLRLRPSHAFDYACNVHGSSIQSFKFVPIQCLLKFFACRVDAAHHSSYRHFLGFGDLFVTHSQLGEEDEGRPDLGAEAGEGPIEGSAKVLRVQPPGRVLVSGGFGQEGRCLTQTLRGPPFPPPSPVQAPC